MKFHTYIGPIVFAAMWALVARAHFIDPFFLPDPWIVAGELLDLLASGAIFEDLLATIERVVLAFGISFVIGVPLGLVLGRSEKLYRSVEFVIDFFRSTPSTAIFPLFLLLFGVSDLSKVAVAAFASVLVIVFNTAHGVMHTKKVRVLAAQVMGATQLQIFRWISLWESLPQTFVGLRSAVSLSLVIIVVTEMFIGSDSGLGRRIIDAQITYEIPVMYATIFVTGVIGYALNLVFVLIERRFLHWSGK